MADLYAIGDLGDTTDDLLSYAQNVVDTIDPFAEAASAADALTNGGGDSSDGSGSDVPLGEGDPSALADSAGGGFSFADQSAVVGAPAAVAAASGVQNLNPGVVSGGGGGGGGMVVAPSAPIGPGTTTPTGTPWVKYGLGALAVGALAYFAWKWMNKPKRNPRRKRKGRR